ncbi:MAG: hypothetical protein N5P05_004206 (plasmid) [Chroococcopsis gigantea SAG 12.99]|jgi:hypothetical protein|nr:hypothetical protein [Chroococcopsis gigantea SAG 12.99]
MQTTTRPQLIGYGLSDYLATSLTKNIKSVRKERNTYHYLISDVIISIKAYQENKRVKSKTLKSLQFILSILEDRQNNLIAVPFSGGTDKELGELAKCAYKTLSTTLKAFSDLKADVATIKGKKHGRRKSSPKVIQSQPVN